MSFGIWAFCRVYDVYADRSIKKIESSEGWLWDREYDSMELAKIGLAEVKEMLDDGWGDFDVIEENGVILDCF